MACSGGARGGGGAQHNGEAALVKLLHVAAVLAMKDVLVPDHMVVRHANALLVEARLVHGDLLQNQRRVPPGEEVATAVPGHLGLELSVQLRCAVLVEHLGD